MESAFSWSYTLCTPAERDLWASVSVFADSFDLAAAERVCAGDHLLGALSGLVDKSVLVLDRATMRYRLLEPVRQFGCGRLRAAGRDRVLALRSAHRDWYLALAERFAAEWFGPCELEWIERVRVELPNLRAAIEFCLTTPGQEPAGQRLAGALSSFWRPGGALPEGRYWLERALAASRTPRRERLCALDAYGRIQRAQGRLPAAILTARECALTAKLLADRLYEARAVRDLGLTLLLEGDAVRAGPLLDTAARSLARHGESVDGLVMADLGRAMVALSKGDQARATELCAECRRLCLAHGDRWWLEQALTTSAHIAEVGGDSAQARAYVQEGLRSSRTFGDTVTAATATANTIGVAVIGEPPQLPGSSSSTPGHPLRRGSVPPR